MYRERELTEALKKIQVEPHSKILEIGGGNGYQAKLLKNMGYSVSSIDVNDWENGETYFPVQIYDGKRIPFEDQKFDIIFSSNVLEHIENLNDVLQESHRVLKDEGRAIHILPSVSWRFWSILTYYYYVGYRVLTGFGPLKDSRTAKRNKSSIEKRGLLWAVKSGLFPPAHGEFDNCVVELFEYRIGNWKKKFILNGWGTPETAGSGTFYTDKSVLGEILSLSKRKWIAGILGSSCNIFILKKVR
jgi:SAM-dependent methyltransferase